MKFKKQQLRVFDIYCVCEDCNEIMFENPKILQRGKFVYTCPKCGKHYYSDEKYPKRVFEKMGNPIPIER
jgi:DNA-directed RNA polymerase subunit M/transcription elongation factor TFIIS